MCLKPRFSAPSVSKPVHKQILGLTSLVIKTFVTFYELETNPSKGKWKGNSPILSIWRIFKEKSGQSF